MRCQGSRPGDLDTVKFYTFSHDNIDFINGSYLNPMKALNFDHAYRRQVQSLDHSLSYHRIRSTIVPEPTAPAVSRFTQGRYECTRRQKRCPIGELSCKCFSHNCSFRERNEMVALPCNRPVQANSAGSNMYLARSSFLQICWPQHSIRMLPQLIFRAIQGIYHYTSPRVRIGVPYSFQTPPPIIATAARESQTLHSLSYPHAINSSKYTRKDSICYRDVEKKTFP